MSEEITLKDELATLFTIQAELARQKEYSLLAAESLADAREYAAKASASLKRARAMIDAMKEELE